LRALDANFWHASDVHVDVSTGGASDYTKLAGAPNTRCTCMRHVWSVSIVVGNAWRLHEPIISRPSHIVSCCGAGVFSDCLVCVASRMGKHGFAFAPCTSASANVGSHVQTWVRLGSSPSHVSGGIQHPPSGFASRFARCHNK